MDELGFDTTEITSWFSGEESGSFTLVRVGEDHAAIWKERLSAVVRRCYISDEVLDEKAVASGLAKREILDSRLPDPGSTMAGDFGEIVTYLYHVSLVQPEIALGPKKWRLKQDRRKPAPHSDVLHFVLPSWPTPSNQDILLCSEVKAKSTAGAFRPIPIAIQGCEKDRVSRLATTLVWLRERALTEDLGDVKLAHLERFINAAEHPQASKRFHAVAVVCTDLVEGELSDIPGEANPNYKIVVIAVPNLYTIYNETYEMVRASASEPPPSSTE